MLKFEPSINQITVYIYFSCLSLTSAWRAPKTQMTAVNSTTINIQHKQTTHV